MIGGCGGSVLSTTVARAARGRCCGCCEKSQWKHELGDEATKLVKKWDFSHKTGKLDNKTNHTWRLSKIYSTTYIVHRNGRTNKTVISLPNEAIHLCWKQSLINSVYLLLNADFQFPDGDRLSLEPETICTCPGRILTQETSRHQFCRHHKVPVQSNALSPYQECVFVCVCVFVFICTYKFV